MQFTKRWITGLIVALPIIFIIIFGNETVFFAVLLTVSIFCLYEYYSILFRSKDLLKYIFILAGALVSLGMFLGGQYTFGFITLIFLGYSIYNVLSVSDIKQAPVRLTLTLFGIIYIGFLFSHLMLLRKIDPVGRQWVFFVLVATFLADTLAAYTGSYLGKRKLIPRVSPGKTWEGFIGGCAGSILAAIVFGAVFFSEIHFIHFVVLGTAIGVIGLFGDLLESVLKRSVEVKDSGTMLPGHGGWLDRVDALIFTAPFTYYYVKIFLTNGFTGFS